jgi:phosphonate transport system substrate-binding protein
VLVKYLLVIVAALAGLSGAVSPALADTRAPLKLSFGVVPQQEASQLARVWTPLLDYLSNKTGYTIEFRTAPDTITFEHRAETGEFDFAYFNPSHYAAYRASGYLAMARERDTQLIGIVVVPKNSGYKSLKDLNGVTMAFPSPGAFAATILPNLSLKQMGGSVVPKYVASHESVYRTVARGLYPAGGGNTKTYEQVDPMVRDQLRILWKSRPYTPHPIAVHPRVPREVAQRVIAALLAMADDSQGAVLLKEAGFKGFVAAQDSDYEDIRKLLAGVSQSGTAGKIK